MADGSSRTAHAWQGGSVIKAVTRESAAAIMGPWLGNRSHTHRGDLGERLLAWGCVMNTQKLGPGEGPRMLWAWEKVGRPRHWSFLGVRLEGADGARLWSDRQRGAQSAHTCGWATAGGVAWGLQSKGCLWSGSPKAKGLNPYFALCTSESAFRPRFPNFFFKSIKA